MKCDKNNLKEIVLHSKILREWNGHLEIFSRPQENSRQYLLLRTDILHEAVVDREVDSKFLKVNLSLNINCCPSYLGQYISHFPDM